QVRSWRSLAARVLLTATGRAGTHGGPVHLNLQFDGPLTPDAEDGWSAPRGGRARDRAWTVTEELDVRAPAFLAGDERTVVVAGDDAGPPARVLAEIGGWPLLAEPTSGSRTGANAIRTYRLLLEDGALADRIERVVVCGHPTLSRSVTRLLSRADVEVVAVRGPAHRRRPWTDPGHAVGRVVELDPTAAPRDGGARAERPAPSPWLREWLDRDAETATRLDDLLARRTGLTPHEVAGAVARALPARGLLFVGASNPVRDLDLMVPRYEVGARRHVVANRGLSGIDGTVSSAIGAALGRPRSSRAFALMGDVTFLHDLTGLVIGPDEPRPDLTIVVVNDDGGSLFALLEQGAPEHADSFERLFGTPHGADLGALCQGTGTAYTRVTDVVALEAALARPPHGIEVVEAVVRRNDRRALDRDVRALVGG
ncbi:MAG: 2-succinyl-5-enolpyruvyl-6-hydroxy-3-cyclohexene-carboxylate synthase, partial [Nocardioidaceae bacterium]|nr:2-succinyl-5-enolpyruvyl-6-hydroxy-3-cyclohexene-carboxylate synthase [Nocardioidaceae bacterium]